MATTLAEIVSKIASQGKNPDVSFLKDNPEAQTMLLMALLSNANNKNGAAPIDTTDKRKYDSVSSASSSPSPPRDETEGPRRVGRKPVTSDEEDSDNPKSKRKAQNRAAQRAFRERKENHVRILEDRVKELESLNMEKDTALALENEQLKDMIARLQNENAALLGSSSSFENPLSTNSAASDTKRPSKLIRSSNEPAYFSSSASSNSTPETQHQPISIDDILGLDTSVLPSHALLDHSELLGFNNDYTGQLNDMLNQHRLTFATDPSEFDFFYPLANDILDTESIQLPKDEEGTKYINNISKTWDKISEHPRFDEVDMDILCDEMKKKAVCTDEDHDKELQKVLNKHYPIE
ncbi:hypothetical protein INT47_007696 [Mucor saturninus]|uniref:BZIP domain-containing protein n=1 Tax=Mucor saturninus TaxID=64648 RepID=A0A8H7QWJ8_9FUNG|nr:hypothetical protein INT47_007696 [Mucor saturninus]